MKKPRIYIDTSVIGGCLDSEFASESQALIDMAQRGEATLVVSDLLAAEIARGPAKVREIFDRLPEEVLEPVQGSGESERLRDLYVDAGVVGPGSVVDAYHVAIASVEQVDVIVSWNFKHIVHLEKIRAYNAINMRQGYRTLEIRSPREVV